MDACCLKGCKEHHDQDEGIDLSSYLFRETERCFLGGILTCMSITKSYERQTEHSFLYIFISNLSEEMAYIENALSGIELVGLYAGN